MESFTLHERTVTLGGYEYDDGPVRIQIMPRTIRIREFTDAQVETRMLLSGLAGFAVAVLVFVVPSMIFKLPLPL